MKCPKCGTIFGKSDIAAGVCPMFGYDCDYEVKTAQRLADRKRESRKRAASQPAPAPAPAPERKPIQVKVAYDVTVYTADCTSGPDFQVEETDVLNPRIGLKGQWLVVVLESGEVFAGNDVIGIVSDGPKYYAKIGLKFGRAKLFQVSEKVINDMLDRCAYPPRNEREAAVRNRNFEITVWLADLAGL